MPLAQQVFPIVATARDAADLVEPIFAGLSEEKLAVLHLDAGRRLLGLAEGRVEAEAEVNLPIRSIVGDALRFGSAGLILAHNHPSGNEAPSAADVEATRRLAAVLSELDVALHDHLVFAGKRISSFRALRLL
jgi:DNA repair protein RadC